MKKFILQILLFITLLSFSVLSALLYTSLIVENREFKNNNTESNLLIIHENERYNLMFMGISHARNFSRYQNHSKIERILNKKIINIGQGGGACGINEQLYYLNYFYNNNNTVDTIFYILSPPLLFSETLPKASNTFDNEPFKISFFINYLPYKTENKTERLLSYMRSKLQLDWISYHSVDLDDRKDRLLKLDTAEVKKGFKVTYENGLNFDVFNQSCVTLEKTIKLSLSKNSQIILIIPPALFGKWEGHEETLDFANKMKKKYKIELYDYS